MKRRAKASPLLDRFGFVRPDQLRVPGGGTVSFDVTREVAEALRTLRDTGLYGNGRDCASIAEELLRLALRDPEVAPHWRVPSQTKRRRR